MIIAVATHAIAYVFGIVSGIVFVFALANLSGRRPEAAGDDDEVVELTDGFGGKTHARIANLAAHRSARGSGGE